jgi:hypothetical protein
MVIVSDRAKQVLLERKHAAHIDEPEGLRVAVDESGALILVADHPRFDDQLVEHEGATVLLLSPDAQMVLAGMRVDCMQMPDGDVELVLRSSGVYNGHA